MKTRISSQKSHWKNLFVLAGPAIAEQFLITLITYVDTAMVGSLGAGAIAAIAIISSFAWLMNGIVSAIGVGYSVQVALYFGTKNYEQARMVIRQAVLAVVVVGLVIMSAGLVISGQLPIWLGAGNDILADAQAYLRIYLLAIPFQCAVTIFSVIFRCVGDSKTPVLLIIVSNILNIVLNFLLIFPTRWVGGIVLPGAGWGVVGAGIATAISIGVSGIILVVILYRRKSEYQIHLSESYKPDKFIILKAVNLGMPVALERITVSSGQIFMTRMVAGLGTLALASNHVATTAENLGYLPAGGISFAATALVGQSLNAGSKEEARAYGQLSGWVGFGLSMIMGVLLFALSQPRAVMFSSDQEVVELAAQMLRIVALAQPLFGVSIVLSGVFRGAGDTRYPFYMGLVCMIGIRCAFTPFFIFALGWGLEAIWVAMLIDLCVRGVLCIWRLASGKWLKVSGEKDS